MFVIFVAGLLSSLFVHSFNQTLFDANLTEMTVNEMSVDEEVTILEQWKGMIEDNL